MCKLCCFMVWPGIGDAGDGQLRMEYELKESESLANQHFLAALTLCKCCSLAGYKNKLLKTHSGSSWEMSAIVPWAHRQNILLLFVDKSIQLSCAWIGKISFCKKYRYTFEKVRFFSSNCLLRIPKLKLIQPNFS